MIGGTLCEISVDNINIQVLAWPNYYIVLLKVIANGVANKKSETCWLLSSI